MTSAASTWFLRPADVVTIVRRLGLAAFLEGLERAIHEDFLRWHQFDKCARVSSHSPTGVIELMPISDGRCFSFKYVNGHPGNRQRGLPTVMAFGVLADVDTGLPRLVSELTLTTALRTAVTSTLAASVLARAGARVMALVGNGAQSEFQALAFHHRLGIKEVHLFDSDPAAMQRLSGRLQAAGLRVAAGADIAQAVRGADIVTTATAAKTRAALLTPDLVRPGMHLNAIGGDCPGKTELHPDVLRAAQVFVEYEPQTRIEGDIQQLPPAFPVTELWRVLSGQHPGRGSQREVTVFDSVGFALEDFSALCFLYRQAQALGVGQPIDLVPALANPRDLYSLLAT